MRPKTKTSKTLVLNRQTIRSLTAPALARAHGGVPKDTGVNTWCVLTHSYRICSQAFCETASERQCTSEQSYACA